MPTLSLDGETLFYLDRGHGAPVLFVHGAGGTWHHWGLQVRDVAAQGRRAIALDLPGHGRSGGEPRMSIAAYAATVSALMERLQLEGVTLVGHSMGGTIAQWLALHDAERLARLVLTSTGARLRVRASVLRELAHSTLPDGFYTLLAQESYHEGTSEEQLAQAAQQLAETSSRTFLNDYLALNMFDVRDEVHRIALPTLVITGQDDRLTPPANAEFLAETIPGARLMLVEGAGHMVMVEQPAQVSAALLRWIGAEG